MWCRGHWRAGRRVRRSARRGPEVVGDGDEVEVEGVGSLAGIAHAAEPVAALELRERALDRLADAPDQPVAPDLPASAPPSS